MIDTLVRRKGGGAVRSPLDSYPRQDAAKAHFANFRFQPNAGSNVLSWQICRSAAALWTVNVSSASAAAKAVSQAWARRQSWEPFPQAPEPPPP